ncbi:DUF721 domain-containing protein [Membranihabitans marinus]|uniref:DUF721 domain-containing protein n=1 Tax=Membranihabitans marinus TaxID=1227546 RepID=UPI001F467C66|nr:DUF721 domain-containing protein [Membranihabitans marinus]
MNNQSKNLKDILSGIVKDPKYATKIDEKRIESIWRETNAPYIVERTTKVSYRDGKVILFISSAPLKQELFQRRSEILTKINTALGENVVEEILIR